MKEISYRIKLQSPIDIGAALNATARVLKSGSDTRTIRFQG